MSSLPNLASLGLGNLTALQGVPQVRSTRGSYGLMRERSAGKDTTTGHWEIAGVQVDTAFPTFPQGFPTPDRSVQLTAQRQHVGTGKVRDISSNVRKTSSTSRHW